MKRIYSKKILSDFWLEHPDSKLALNAWYDEVKVSVWQSPSDVRRTWRRVSLLKSGRVVFRIKGNKYRIVAKINYVEQWVFILFVGSHKDYDRIDAIKI